MSRNGIRRDPRLRWFLALLAALIIGLTMLRDEPETTHALPDFQAPYSLFSSDGTSCTYFGFDGPICWGRNNLGQYGYGNTDPYPYLYQNFGIAYQSIGAGGEHWCAIDLSVDARCWGKNDYGQLGKDPFLSPDCSGTPCEPSPVQVCADSSCNAWFGGFSGIKLEGGDSHTCALKFSAVSCWGRNTWGQLGDGTNDSKAYAVGATGIDDGLGIGVGGRHSCAIVSANQVKCWGDNAMGQIGNGGFSAIGQFTPASVCDFGVGGCSGNLSGITQLTAGDAHTCALTSSGTVFCWGSNQYGQVGSVTGDACTGSLPCSYQPQQVPGLTGVTQIVAGANHTCAIANGAVRCWGRNHLGQLGNGTEVDTTSHTLANGLTSGTQVISAGAAHTCAIDALRAVRCWGDGRQNILADAPTASCLFGGSTACATTPQIIGYELDGRPSIAVLGPHAGRVTGTDFTLDVYGQYFNANSRVRFGYTTLAPPTVISENHLQVTVPSSLIASFEPFGVTVFNPGYNGFDTESSTRSFEYFNPIAAGGGHSCRVTAAGAAECWGDNQFGQLGRGTSGGSSNVAQTVSGLASGVARVVVGDDFSCALLNTASVKCWGANNRYQLGTGAGGPEVCGSTDCSTTPVALGGLTSGVIAQIAAGGQHACAVQTYGDIVCWGRGTEGQLGDGTAGDSVQPGGLSEGWGIIGVDKLALGRYHSCFTGLGSGQVYCWGDNQFGAFGDGTTDSTTAPTPGAGNYRSLAAGDGFTCGVPWFSAGEVRCWGSNAAGQLGYVSFNLCGDSPCSLTPEPVSGFPSGQAFNVTAGGKHACAVAQTLMAYCWGSDEFGQIGDGPPSGATAVPVSAPAGLTAVQGISEGAKSTCAAQLDGVVKCWGNNFLGQVGANPYETCGAVSCSTVPIPLGSSPVPVPTISGFNPPTAILGSGLVAIQVLGSNFIPGSIVVFGSVPWATTYVGPAVLTIEIDTNWLPAGYYAVYVDNGGGTVSEYAIFEIVDLTPHLNQISPNFTSTGGPGLVLSAFGSGFQPNSVVRWNGSERATTYVNGGELHANITAGDIAANTTAAIDVFTPGGGDSADINFYVSDIAVNTVNPTSVLVSSGPFTLTVSGSGFQPGDQVLWSGSQMPFSTTYVNANTLTVDIPGSWIIFPEAATIAVQSGVVQSNAVPFSVNNPTPALTSLSPDSAPSGTPGLVLTVTGSGFVEGFEGGFAPGPRGLRTFGGTTVRVNGDPRPTTFVDPATLEISLTGDDLASPGSLAIVANNVGPGGGTTNTLFFTVFALNPPPVVGSLSPPAAVVGATNLQVLVSGSGFVPQSVVNWNGSPRATTFLSPTTLSVLLLDGDLAAPAVANITVFSPSPGGGTSAPLPFTVTNFALTTISPNTVDVGSGDVTITLTGIGFQPGDSVVISDSGLSTTFVSGTQLTALVPGFFTSFSHSWPVFVSRGSLQTNVVFLEVVEPPPVITSLGPPSAFVGSAGFTLQVHGDHFMEGEGPSSTVYFNGLPRSTTFINQGLLEIDLLSSDLLSPGLVPVQVFNPSEGLFSNTVYFEINVPIQVQAVMPARRVAGTGGFTMVIIGNGFEPPDPDLDNEDEGILTWNGIPRAFTYISDKEIRVTILDSEVAFPATNQFVVSNSSGSAPPATFIVVDGVAQPRTGGLHTCARQVTSVVSCWGEGQYGQLGYTPQSSATPPFSPGPQPVPGLTGVTALAAGDYHTCAVTGGLVKCWGLNGVGQLGDGTNADRTVPTTVPGLTNVTAVAAGAFHTCALSVPAGATSGGVSCWGFNGLGQLGAPATALCGSSLCSTAPLPVTGLESGVVSIVAGGDHSCAVLSSGAMRCWGGNGSGQLGNGNTTNSTVPVNVTGLAGVTAVATGSYHTCAVASGILACWGANGFGQLGAPGGSTCGVPSVAGRSLEVVPAWARGEPGIRAALGSPECALAPVPVTGISNISSVSAGFGHTCAITNAGAAYCWGWNSYGQVGDGTTQLRTTPTLVAGMAGATKTISAGAFHTCALNTGGGLRCWGNSSYGQVGDGSAVQRDQPAPVQGFAGAPVLTGLSPSSAPEGSPPVAVNLLGQGFVFGATNVVTSDASPPFPSVLGVTATWIDTIVPAQDLAYAGSYYMMARVNSAGGADSLPSLFTIEPAGTITAQVSGGASFNGGPAPNGSVVTMKLNGSLLPTSPPTVTTTNGLFTFQVSAPAGVRGGPGAEIYINGVLAAQGVTLASGAVTVQLATANSVSAVTGATGTTWFGPAQPFPALPAAVTAVFEWDNAHKRFAFWFRGFPAPFNTLTALAPGHHYFLQTTAPATVPMTGGSFALPQPSPQALLSLGAGATGAHWTGSAQPNLAALPAAVTAVFRWNSTAQQFDFWFRGFPANFQTLTTGLNYGGYYFFQSSQPVQAPMP